MANGTYEELLDIFKELPNYDELVGWKSTVCDRIEALGVEPGLAHEIYAMISLNDSEIEAQGGKVVRYTKNGVSVIVDIPYIFRKDDSVQPTPISESGDEIWNVKMI